jgi:hypothetical protein
MSMMQKINLENFIIDQAASAKSRSFSENPRDLGTVNKVKGTLA